MYPTGLKNAGTDHEERERRIGLYSDVGEVYRAAAGHVSGFYRSAISRARDGLGNAYRSATDFCREIPEYPMGAGGLAAGVATAIASLYIGDSGVSRLAEGAGALVSGAGLSCIVRGLFRGMEKKMMKEERAQWSKERETHYEEMRRLTDEVHSLSVSLQEQQRRAESHAQRTTELRRVIYGNGRPRNGAGLELTEEDIDELSLPGIEREPDRLETVA